MNRSKYITLFFGALVPALAAVVINPFSTTAAMTLWVLGLTCAAVALGGLQKSISKDNLNPELADEYQRARIDTARSAAFRYALAVLGTLMALFLFLPLLSLAGFDNWPELVRSCGMLTGVALMGLAFVQLFVIARGLSRDEAWSSADEPTPHEQSG